MPGLVFPWIKMILKPQILDKVTLEVVSTTVLLVRFECLKESTCETWKNVFYFTSKAHSILEIKF